MKRRIELLTEQRKSRVSLTLMFSLIVFGVLLVSVGIAVLLAYIFAKFGWLDIGRPESLNPTSFLLFVVAVSVVVGFGIAMLVMKVPLRPVNYLITQMNRLAAGDFKVRLVFGKMVSSYPAFCEVRDSFNKMAEELEGAQMLRTDFINNFSHEFKTPIVSIAGFAKLLQKANLTEQQRAEYIDIIEEESRRLADMATNVLNLTKVENQTILTEVTAFNLSEQVRSCVLLLESKWRQKETVFALDFDEYTVRANEELLKQVFINLIDNAVKFSPRGGKVDVRIAQSDKLLSVSITNAGEIPPADQKRIFNKFYQGDTSHSGEGNGVGLAIVKKVVELHGGSVLVASEEGNTTFTVLLPRDA